MTQSKGTKIKAVAKITSAQEWKKPKSMPLDLPSGNTALVKNPGMRAFLEADLLPNSLMPLVTEALERGKPPSREALQGKVQDLDMVQQMLQSIDDITIYCVVEPPVRSDRWTTHDEVPKGYQIGEKIPDTLRDEDLLYIDEVDDQDKMYIFNWAVGGTRDLERFREEYEESLAAI